MRLQYFGDSYDIVKQSMLQWLSPYGPWAAHPMFTDLVTEEDARAFSTFLGVPLISDEVLTDTTDRNAYFRGRRTGQSLFLDPDTGLSVSRVPRRRLPQYLLATELVTLANATPEGLCMVFDQALQRGAEGAALQAKMHHLKEHGIHAFAYKSHASFIVAGASPGLVEQARSTVLAASALPGNRLLATAG